MATLKDWELYSGLEGNQTVVYAVTQIPLLSLQSCRNFQTRKLACNAIWFYVNYMKHVKVFWKLYYILSKLIYWCKWIRIISNDIISTTWTKQNKKRLFLRKLSSLHPILYTHFLVLSTVPDDLFPFDSMTRKIVDRKNYRHGPFRAMRKYDTLYIACAFQVNYW